MAKKLEKYIGGFAFLMLILALAPMTLCQVLPAAVCLSLLRARKAAAAVALLLALFRFHKVKKLPPFLWLFGALELWIFVVSFFKTGPQYAINFLTDYACPIATFALLFYAVSDKDSLVNSFLFSYEFWILANLASMLICGKSGLYRNEVGYPHFLMGTENQYIMYALPAIALALLRLFHGRTVLAKGNALFLIVVSCFMVLWGGSATGIICLVVSAGVFILHLSPALRRIFSPLVLFFLALWADLSIVVFRIAENVPFITSFIQNVLHKRPDFTSRTIVWDAFLQFMPGHWFTGLGYAPGTMFVIDSTRIAAHAHNQYYELLAEGGFIALILFMAFFALVVLRLQKSRGTWLSAGITALVIGLLVFFIPETANPSLYPLLLIALELDNLYE